MIAIGLLVWMVSLYVFLHLAEGAPDCEDADCMTRRIQVDQADAEKAGAIRLRESEDRSHDDAEPKLA